MTVSPTAIAAVQLRKLVVVVGVAHRVLAVVAAAERQTRQKGRAAPAVVHCGRLNHRQRQVTCATTQPKEASAGSHSGALCTLKVCIGTGWLSARLLEMVTPPELRQWTNRRTPAGLQAGPAARPVRPAASLAGPRLATRHRPYLVRTLRPCLAMTARKNTMGNGCSWDGMVADSPAGGSNSLQPSR